LLRKSEGENVPDYLAVIKWGTLIFIGSFLIAAELLFLRFLTKPLYPTIPSSFYGRLWRGYVLLGLQAGHMHVDAS
jgi:hypothetical protein